MFGKIHSRLYTSGLVALGLVLMLAARAAGQEPSARIMSVKTDFDVTRDNAKGILINVQAHVDGMRSQQVRLAAYFFTRDNRPLSGVPGSNYTTPDGQVTSQVLVTPAYDSTDFDRIELFLPYDALNLKTAGKYELSYHVHVMARIGDTWRILTESENVNFWYSRGSPGTTPTNLIGTWEGNEDLGGYGVLTFELQTNGVAVMIDKDGRTPGTWSVQGTEVVLMFYNNTVVYRGTLSGSTIAGTTTNGRVTWNFSVTRK